MKLKLAFTETEQPRVEFAEPSPVSLRFSEGGGGTGNYNALTNKPSINDVVLMGNKTFEDLGDAPLTNLEIKTMFDRIFGKGD